MAKGADAAEAAVYYYLKDYLSRHTYPPTLREIAAGAGVSSAGTARRLLVRLRLKGKVSWTRSLSRTLRLTA